MNVKLIRMTENPIDVMWVAARTCYSEKSPIEMWEDRYGATSDGCEYTQEWMEQCTEKHWKLVKQVLSSGHASIAEHIYFTFVIEGVSRSLLAQITRHRAGIVFSVQSQRYVEIKEDIKLFENKSYTAANYTEEKEIMNVLDKYFIWNHNNYAQFHLLCNALYSYLFQVRDGMKPEDARQVLPNATKTNITMSINLRELMHVSNLRLCTRAQAEIRQLFQAIKKEVEQKDERLASLLVPSCEVHGFCTEHKCCGRKPKLEEIKEGYEKYKGLNK